MAMLKYAVVLSLWLTLVAVVSSRRFMIQPIPEQALHQKHSLTTETSTLTSTTTPSTSSTPSTPLTTIYLPFVFDLEVDFPTQEPEQNPEPKPEQKPEQKSENIPDIENISCAINNHKLCSTVIVLAITIHTYSVWHVWNVDDV